MRAALVFAAAISLGLAGTVALATTPVRQAVSFARVTVDDPFWTPRIRQIQEVTVPDLFDLAEQQGKLDNFRIVAGRKAGRYRTYNAADSDVYKLIEAAAYTLAWRRSSELEGRLDALVDDIVSAQQPDGYLNTQFTLPPGHPSAPPAEAKFVQTFGFGPAGRWNSRADNWPKNYAQLYCAGHLMEAAVAYRDATGKTALFAAAVRLADHLVRQFPVGLLHGWKLAPPPRFPAPDPIDATLVRVGDEYRAYYRVGRGGGIQWSTSRDLVEWSHRGACGGEVNIPAARRGFDYQEAPYVFRFASRFWMLTDPHKGLAVYTSADGEKWNLQGRILEKPGTGAQDATLARHPSVAVIGERAFLFYHTEPNRPYPTPPPEKRTTHQKISFLQVAELRIVDGVLRSDRDAVVEPPTDARPAAEEGPRIQRD